MDRLLADLLQRKLLEVEELQRQINAIKIVAKLTEQSAAAKTTSNNVTKPKSRAETNRDRFEIVLGILRANPSREFHTKDLGSACAVAPETMKEWLVKKMEELGEGCLWVQGRNSYHFRYREIRPSEERLAS